MIPSAHQSPADSDLSAGSNVFSESGPIELPRVLEEAVQVRVDALRRGDSSELPETLGASYESLRTGSLERRQSGAHYTPHALTGPMARATLAPLLEG